MAYIYVVFTSTPYKLGRAIRALTGGGYNHVSISLTEDLSEMYGFARRHYRLPLYGGFVKESLARYWPNGRPSKMALCPIPVSEEQYDAIRRRLHEMYENKEQYLYNHISVLTTPHRRWIKCRDAYICVEFVAEILQEIGVLPPIYYTVPQLLNALLTLITYEGEMPRPTEDDPEFFARKPVPHPLRTTLKAIFALPGRIIR